MSTTTLKLPYKRFIAQVSTGAPRSKSTYLALMAENLVALQACPWREAADVPASLTGHDFTAQTQFSDAYDAFKLTGNYNTSTMTEIAYAGMAAYRFTVPAAAISGSVPVTSVSLPISRDRFEKSGVHLAVALSNSATPSTDWATVRGSGDLAASSQLAQTTAANLMAGAPGAGTVAVDLSGVSSGNPATYLWVYVTLEDYSDHWEMYNAHEKRLYAIEGSAMLSADRAEAVFNGELNADDIAYDHSERVAVQYLRNAISGLTGFVYARCTFYGDPVTKENYDANLEWNLSGLEHIYCEEGAESEPRGPEHPINALYAQLERGEVWLKREDRGVRAGASFSIGKLESGIPLWSQYDMLLSSHLVPILLPEMFMVRRIIIDWSRYFWDRSSHVPTENTSAAYPSFDGPAVEHGRINVWIKDGAYENGFTEDLLKNPRIYDARERLVAGWSLLGRITHDMTSSSDRYIINLNTPLKGPCVTLLFTAWVPHEAFVLADMYSQVQGTNTFNPARPGVCPLTVSIDTSGSTPDFVPNSAETTNTITFVPGVILEG